MCVHNGFSYINPYKKPSFCLINKIKICILAIKYRLNMLQSRNPKKLSNKDTRDDALISLRMGNKIDIKGGWRKGTCRRPALALLGLS